MTEITLEQAQEFYEVLQGATLPDGWHMTYQPHLTKDEAFSMIWFLQERYGVIPDHYEQCTTCDQLYDTHQEGSYIDGDDIPDDWQQEIGVTEEMLREHAGHHFCSTCCEARYWDNILENPRG